MDSGTFVTGQLPQTLVSTTESPLNVKGTAILVPGQYVGVYTIDMHAGKYLALCERAGPVTVWRDNDLDRVLDEDVETESGYFGINIHASSSTPYDQTRDRDEDSDVGVWSAGCQVHATTTGFREMMDLVNKQIETHPSWEKAFTYTLLDPVVLSSTLCASGTNRTTS